MLNEFFNLVFSTSFLTASITYSTPFILAAMGGIVSERSGVMNLGLEGMMLTGALFAFVGSYFTGSPVIGVLFAVLASVVLGVAHAIACVEFGANQVISAVAINIFSVGLTSALFKSFFENATGQLSSSGFEKIQIPILKSIPILGTAVFSQNIFTYLAIILVPLTYIIFYKTKIGLKIRASGEYPKAANTMGVKVQKVRILSVVYSSAIAGIAGASLSIAGINTFIENISEGRGFIAFACVIFGKFNPVGTAIAALMFGFADGLQLRVQATGLPIPYQLPLMLPYILAFIMLFLSGKNFSPQNWGVPYFANEEE